MSLAGSLIRRHGDAMPLLHMESELGILRCHVPAVPTLEHLLSRVYLQVHVQLTLGHKPLAAVAADVTLLSSVSANVRHKVCFGLGAVTTVGATVNERRSRRLTCLTTTSSPRFREH